MLLLPESLIQAAFQTTARLDSTPMAILASMLDTAWWLMMAVPNVLPDRGHERSAMLEIRDEEMDVRSRAYLAASERAR